MNFLAETFNYLIQSDASCYCEASIAARFVDWMAYSLAHCAMGMFAAILVIFRDWNLKFAWTLLGLIVAKELYGDISQGNGLWIIVSDSIWDVATYFLGFMAVYGGAGLHHNLEGVK